MFHFYVDKQQHHIPCSPSHDEMPMSESLEAFPLEAPGIDISFFFFFKLAFLRTQQIHQVKKISNSLVVKLHMFFFYPLIEHRASLTKCWPPAAWNG